MLSVIGYLMRLRTFETMPAPSPEAIVTTLPCFLEKKHFWYRHDGQIEVFGGLNIVYEFQAEAMTISI